MQLAHHRGQSRRDNRLVERAEAHAEHRPDQHVNDLAVAEPRGWGVWMIRHCPQILVQGSLKRHIPAIMFRTLYCSHNSELSTPEIGAAGMGLLATLEQSRQSFEVAEGKQRSHSIAITRNRAGICVAHRK